jgi:hypothetical protein
MFPQMATFGRPRKEIDHRTAHRIIRRCKELKVKLVLVEEEKEADNAKLTMEVEEFKSTVDASLSSVSASLAVAREEVKIARSLDFPKPQQLDWLPSQRG